MDYIITHLKQLESESIHILREVGAEFENPVMLYSIGKDSSVMLRLAQKAFYPGKIPFPLMHIDTLWKFREMIDFRENTKNEIGFDLIVYTNLDGVSQQVNPFSPPRFAQGTTFAPDVFIAGEEGPELIVGARGSTVFTADETRRILHNPPDAFSGTRSAPAEKKIVIDIQGRGEISVKGMDEDALWALLEPDLKNKFMAMLRVEVAEEGDMAFDY